MELVSIVSIVALVIVLPGAALIAIVLSPRWLAEKMMIAIADLGNNPTEKQLLVHLKQHSLLNVLQGRYTLFRLQQQALVEQVVASDIHGEVSSKKIRLTWRGAAVVGRKN